MLVSSDSNSDLIFMKYYSYLSSSYASFLELESYDCRTTTTSPVISTSTSVEVSSSQFVPQTSSGGNQSLHSNQTQDWIENFRLRFEHDDINL